MTGFESGIERIFVDDATTGGVDDSHSLGHLGDGGGVEKAQGFGGTWHVRGYKVRLPDGFIEAHTRLLMVLAPLPGQRKRTQKEAKEASRLCQDAIATAASASPEASQTQANERQDLRPTEIERGAGNSFPLPISNLH